MEQSVRFPNSGSILQVTQTPMGKRKEYNQLRGFRENHWPLSSSYSGQEPSESKAKDKNKGRSPYSDTGVCLLGIDFFVS